MAYWKVERPWGAVTMGATTDVIDDSIRNYDLRLSALCDQLRRFHDDPQQELIEKAFSAAFTAHRGQTRITGEPYIVHPLAVAYGCAEHGLDPVGTASALLHDCVEDSALGRADLEREFGPEVARIVEGLTKLGRGEASGEERTIRSLRKLLRATRGDDPRTMVIKIFDRVDNARTLDVHQPEKQRRIATETLQFFVPIARRLGLFKQARFMEDSVMRVLKPSVYEAVTRWLNRNQTQMQRSIEPIAREICDLLASLGINSRYHLAPKGVYAIFEALPSNAVEQRLDTGCNLELLFVVDDENACFRTLAEVHRRLDHHANLIRDFINDPKVNGYRSLHTICTPPDSTTKLQVIIRTEAMHREAEIGIIAQINAGMEPGMDWLEDLEESTEDADADALLEMSSKVFFPEIGVQTPRGEYIKLPHGATALDFAYAVHTEVGRQAVEAWIDGVKRSLSTVLHSDQQVEIVTAVGATPSYNQLKSVTTTRAALGIRTALSEVQEEGVRSHLDRLRGFFLKLGLDIDDGDLLAMAERFGLASLGELGGELYAGRLDHEHLVPVILAEIEGLPLHPLGELLVSDGVLSPEEIEATEAHGRDALRDLLIRRSREHLSSQEPVVGPVHVHGLHYPIQIRLAQCCGPEFGDPIVAVTSRKLIMIHRAQCTEIRHLVDCSAIQVAEAEWAHRPAVRTVRFAFEATDRRGLGAALTNVLGKLKVEMRSAHIDSSEGMARGTLGLELNDLTDPHDVARRLRSIGGMRYIEPLIDEGYT